jgi:hypothetical protein
MKTVSETETETETLILNPKNPKTLILNPNPYVHELYPHLLPADKAANKQIAFHIEQPMLTVRCNTTHGTIEPWGRHRCLIYVMLRHFCQLTTEEG